VGRHRRCNQDARTLAALVVLLAASAFGCATAPPAPVPVPTDAERRAAEAAGFELPEVASARALLPLGLLSGPHHTVSDPVYTDGSLHIYTIVSDFGTFEARGDDMLRVRLHEVEVLAAMEEMHTSKEFAAAAGRALASPFVATWNVISNPVDTILGVPKGAWEKIQRTSELARGDRGELEDSAFKELIGFERKKRQIAAELDVDPYSSNKVLQRSLNRFAWAAYAGELPSMFVPFTGTGSEDSGAPAAVSEDDRVQQILLRYSPEDLDRLNRIELAVMGTPKPLGEQFIHHPWFSPRHETAVVENLAALDLARNRVAFIEAAVTADSEEDAHFYQRTAELMRRYSDGVERIDQIVTFGRTVTGLGADGTLVVPLAADHALWSPATSEFVDSFTETPPELEIRRKRLLVSGTLSPRARAKIESHDVEVVEKAFDELPTSREPLESDSTGGG
jgi:hypothetical protein